MTAFTSPSMFQIGTGLTVPVSTSQPAAEVEEDLSPWRVAGYASNGNDAIIFVDVGGRALMQRVADKKAVISGQYVEFELDGKKVGTFTGKEKKRESGLPGTN